MVMEKVSTLVSKDIGNYLTNRASWNIFYNAKSEGMKGDGTTDDYAKLSTLINTTINGAEATIIFSPGTYKISTSITVPSNITLFITKGAMLSPDSGKIITINGPIEAGLWKIFTGSGTIAGSMKIDEVYPQWWGAKGDGVTDDTTAIQATFSSISAGGTIYFPNGTYIISKQINITTKCKVNSDGAIIKFASVFDDQGTNALSASNITANEVEINGLTFDGSSTTNKSVDNRFIWVDSTNVKIDNCIFKSLPAGGSNFNGAVGYSITSSQGEVSNCRFFSCPGSVFAKAPRTRIINCISESPSDVSYALNGPTCIGSSVIGCKVYAPNLTCSIHIGVEESASKFIIADNYVFGVKDGIGIGCVNVGFFDVASGGIIHNNIIDGNNQTTTSPCAMIKVSEFYKNIKVHDNTLLNTPTGNANTITVSISSNDNEFYNNKIVEDSASVFLASIYVVPAGGQLTLADNDITARGTGQIVLGAAGNNGGKPLFSKCNWYRNTNSEGINLLTPTNMPLWMENDNFVSVANPVNATSAAAWQNYFNAFDTYRWPHSIKEVIVMYGDSVPTTGTWVAGSVIYNYAPAQLGTSPNKYVLMGWVRVTNGSGNVLNTDWMEMRQLTGN